MKVTLWKGKKEKHCKTSMSETIAYTFIELLFGKEFLSDC